MITKSIPLNKDEILNFLIITDNTFLPNPLSKRIDINEYSEKLATKSNQITIWEDNKLIGLSCFYLNENTRKAYISVTCIHPLWQKKGIGKLITKAVEEYLLAVKFDLIEFEVHIENIVSIKMHEALGFKIDRKEGNSFYMIKEIR